MNTTGFNSAKNKNGTTTAQKRGVRVGTEVPAPGDVFSAIHQQKTSNETSNGAKKQDINEIWKTYKNGDEQARFALLAQLEPTIDAAIQNMAGGDKRYKTKARLITMDALNGFDPNAGATLQTFVYNRLQSLRRLSADRGNFIQVPERSALERRQLEDIKRDYMLETGVEPSLGELADRSGMSVNKVGRLMSIFGTTATSTTRGEHGDSLEAKPRTATELYNDSFYTELPEIDKKIYEWTTGYQGSPMLDRATIARKLRISEAAVSQHAKKIDRMAAKFESNLSRELYGGVAQNA